MSENPEARSQTAFTQQATEAAIRIGILILLVGWCFQIVRPFVVPLIWGAILATAVYPAYARLNAVLGQRSNIAAGILTLVGVVLLIVPSVMLGERAAGTISGLADQLNAGSLSIPRPNPWRSVFRAAPWRCRFWRTPRSPGYRAPGSRLFPTSSFPRATMRECATAHSPPAKPSH